MTVEKKRETLKENIHIQKIKYDERKKREKERRAILY
jgi:hypothetical protein